MGVPQAYQSLVDHAAVRPLIAGTDLDLDHYVTGRRGKEDANGPSSQDYGHPEKSVRFVNITWGYFSRKTF